jgi:hypothetical protein
MGRIAAAGRVFMPLAGGPYVGGIRRSFVPGAPVLPTVDLFGGLKFRS